MKWLIRRRKKQLGLLYFLGFLLAMAGALPAYIQSSFLEDFLGISWVSILFLLSNIIAFLAILFFPRIIKGYGNLFSTKMILVIFIVSLLGLSISRTIWGIMPSFIAFSLASTIIWINMDILVEGLSNDASTGRIRAFYFTSLNTAWILAPSLSAWMTANYGYYLAFLVAAIFLLPFFLIVFWKKKSLKDRFRYKNKPLKKTMQGILKNKNLRGIFVVALLLSIFYSGAVVFIPLYLHEIIGLEWSVLGPMFSVMLIPFVLIQIPAGIIADKYLGEKEMLFVGLTILIISLTAFFWTSSLNPIVWGGLLFFSRIGAALVEAMRESYFFKQINANNIDYINFFRAANPLGYIVGSALAAIILIFLPLPYVFLSLAIVLLSGFFFIYPIKDSR